MSELERLGSFDEARAEHDELALAGGNPFATWEWLSTWWRHYGGGRELALFRVRRPDGATAALIPLYAWRNLPLRILRFAGHGPGDELGPISAPADAELAREGLRRVLAGLRWHAFLGEQLPGDAGWAEVLGARVLRREGSPVTALDGCSWEEALAGFSSNLRSQIRRYERKLAREHGLVFRRTDDEARLEADLDCVFALHRARWTGSDAFAGTGEPFQREFARTAFRRGWLRLWFMELDGRPRAAWYGLRFAGVDSFYQGGRDPTWHKPSLGMVLLAHTIREAANDGMREYRLLRGGESYKYRFATSDPGLETVGLARGPLGGAVLAALSHRFARADADR